MAQVQRSSFLISTYFLSLFFPTQSEGNGVGDLKSRSRGWHPSREGGGHAPLPPLCAELIRRITAAGRLMEFFLFSPFLLPFAGCLGISSDALVDDNSQGEPHVLLSPPSLLLMMCFYPDIADVPGSLSVFDGGVCAGCLLVIIIIIIIIIITVVVLWTLRCILHAPLGTMGGRGGCSSLQCVLRLGELWRPSCIRRGLGGLFLHGKTNRENTLEVRYLGLMSALPRGESTHTHTHSQTHTPPVRITHTH